MIRFFIFHSAERFQRRAAPPWARGHPIGGAQHPVGWGFQRGQRSLGTRLCLQSPVCYTFARGWQRTACFARRDGGKTRRTRAGIAERLQQQAAACLIPGAKGYRPLCCRPITPVSTIVLRNRLVSQLIPWHHFDITSWYHS